MTAVRDCVGTAPTFCSGMLVLNQNTKTILMVYTNFPVGFIKSTISMNLICILDWRGLYSVFQELKGGKKANNYWIVLSHIRSVV